MADEQSVEELTLGQRILGGSVLAALAGGGVWLWANHEPAPHDPCQALRDYFAEVHDEARIHSALKVPVRVVVTDIEISERNESGVPCGIGFELDG